MSILTRILRSAVPAVVVAIAALPAAADAQLTVVGASSGCFGAGCVNFSNAATLGASGISYTAGGFNRTLYGPSDFDFISLGSLHLVEDPQNGVMNGVFRLRITFTAPASAQQSVFTADVDGIYRSGLFNYDEASIDFGGAQTINYAGGSFQLHVFDVDLENWFLDPSDDQAIIGKVYGWQSGGGSGVGSVVPEPSTYVLLGTGIAALGLVARRRRNG